MKVHLIIVLVHIQNVLVDQLNSSFVYVGYLGNLILRNFTAINMMLEEGTHLIDHDGVENLGADYMLFDNVNLTVRLIMFDLTFKNTYVNSAGILRATIKSFIQYKRITIMNSIFKGVGFSIKGEQIGGNLKSNVTVFIPLILTLNIPR